MPSRHTITPAVLELLGAHPERAARFATAIDMTLAARVYVGAETAEQRRLRASHFLGQIFHESGRLMWTEEIWGPTKQQRRYDPATGSSLAKRLGNVRAGDGYRYRGRGLIQLTGRHNYARYSDATGGNFISDPDAVATLPWSVDVAGWYWQERGIGRLADQDDLRGVTRAINGGVNGLRDREMLTRHARAVLEGAGPLLLPPLPLEGLS